MRGKPQPVGWNQLTPLQREAVGRVLRAPGLARETRRLILADLGLQDLPKDQYTRVPTRHTGRQVVLVLVSIAAVVAGIVAAGRGAATLALASGGIAGGVLALLRRR